jgi:hypothetical protein
MMMVRNYDHDHSHHRPLPPPPSSPRHHHHPIPLYVRWLAAERDPRKLGKDEDHMKEVIFKH